MVDWSAANQPKTGRDSVWLASAERTPKGSLGSIARLNPATRTLAIDALSERLATWISAARRVLVGVDFALGYPAGFVDAAHLALGRRGPEWLRPWTCFAERVTDDAQNRSNRFVVADWVNRTTGVAWFWGRPKSARFARLTALAPRRDELPAGLAKNPLPPLRLAERRAGRGIKSPWQLYGGVTVGSQSLVGLHHLAQLRARLPGALAVWPFETGLGPGEPDATPVVLAEIWPSRFSPGAKRFVVPDEVQVTAALAALAAADEAGRLGKWLAPELLRSAPAEVRQRVVEAEGWILGVE
jgi:precorrin-8X/cobalt-precorrin-8 methylmutase